MGIANGKSDSIELQNLIRKIMLNMKMSNSSCLRHQATSQCAFTG